MLPLFLMFSQSASLCESVVSCFIVIVLCAVLVYSFFLFIKFVTLGVYIVYVFQRFCSGLVIILCLGIPLFSLRLMVFPFLVDLS